MYPIKLKLIGIGGSLAAPPSTPQYVRVTYTAVRQNKPTWQMSVDRKMIAPCTNPGFTPFPLGQRFPLDGCITWVLHDEDLPLFSSPRGEPFGPSEILSPNMPSADFFFSITPILNAQSRHRRGRTQLPRAQRRSPGVRHRTFRA
jgi:hypothetical protein